MDNVENFKYMGRSLEQTDNDWPDVRRNLMRAWRVWGRLGKMLRREGADPKVAAMVYWVVTQAVILFGSDTWVLLAKMDITVEGTHTRFLIKITRNQERRKAYRTRSNPEVEEVREVVGTQPDKTYTRIRPGTVAQWVDRRKIFYVYARETGHGGGRAQEGRMVAPRGAGDTSQGNPGVNLAGSKEEAMR